VRGEYTLSPIANSSVLELPPRARRIQVKPFFPRLRGGTTSACAENTQCPKHQCLSQWNYLRVRGEYSAFRSKISWISELPPRARRIRRSGRNLFPLSGTTSACAENTFISGGAGGGSGNYLRVRGEYPSQRLSSRPSPELPPRARRIRNTVNFAGLLGGTTSACAENTVTEQQRNSELRNYLRVRGEYEGRLTVTVARLELPPRARRILHMLPPPNGKLGTTSACAENTLNELGLL